jgi:signal transduction histidine kinase
VVAVSTVARDVTEQRWMAETLDSTLLQLQTALSEAQTAEESSRRFLADAAHQLRTPLAGIRGCAELLLRGAAESDRDRLLAVMVRETTRSAHLITALLRIARLDQGEPLPPGEVDVALLCEDEVERLSLLAPELDISLDVSGAPSAGTAAGRAQLPRDPQQPR